MTRSTAAPICITALLAALLTVKLLGLRWMAHWGATAEELRSRLPGDELLDGPELTTTRAITVNVPAADIWPWIAQLGQGRGGFYSYDALENLVGCDIHSADKIVPAWQDVAIGAEVRLAPGVALTAAVVQPNRAHCATASRSDAAACRSTPRGRSSWTRRRTAQRGW